MAKDPYKLLGIAKSATDAEIRKAYRALAKKLHPDVNPGDEKTGERFKEVTAAYNLLSDKALRAQYDSGQVDASGQQQAPFGFRGGGRAQQAGFGGGDDMADLFASLFGMNMGSRRGGMHRPQPRPQKGADIRYKLKLSFLDSLKGGQRTLRNGLKLKIPKGVKDGQVLRLRGKGNQGVNGGPNGDAKIEITVSAHKYLKRDGDRLTVTLPISLREAVLGAKVRVPLPGAVQLTIPPGTSSGKKFRLKGKGFNGGDLVVIPQIMLDPDLQDPLETCIKSLKNKPDFNPRENFLS